MKKTFFNYKARSFTWLFVIIVMSNFPPLKWIYTWFDQDDYNYTTYDGSFTFSESQFKGRDFKMCESTFTNLKTSGQLPDSSRLYRLNENSIWKFWRWGDYLLKKKYKLIFLDWSEVKQRRGNVSSLHNQDF